MVASPGSSTQLVADIVVGIEVGVALIGSLVRVTITVNDGPPNHRL